jgi:hypothetical protein
VALAVAGPSTGRGLVLLAVVEGRPDWEDTVVDRGDRRGWWWPVPLWLLAAVLAGGAAVGGGGG